VNNPWIGRLTNAGRIGGAAAAGRDLTGIDYDGTAPPLNDVFAGFRMPVPERPMYGPPAPTDYSHGFNDFWGSVSSGLEEPVFHGKTLMEWMEDKRTNGIVDDTIRAENRPIRELIKEEKKQLATDLHNIQTLDEEYDRSINAKIGGLRHNEKVADANYAEHVSEIQSDADEALSNILSMYNSTDDRSQKAVVEDAAERRVPDESHKDGITSLATEHLAEIAAIESAQANQDIGDRRAESRDTVRQARSQISSNWGKKRGLIAELASQLADDDLQRFQIKSQNRQAKNNLWGMALQNYPNYMGGSSVEGEARLEYEKARARALGKSNGEFEGYSQIGGYPVQVNQNIADGTAEYTIPYPQYMQQ